MISDLPLLTRSSHALNDMKAGRKTRFNRKIARGDTQGVYQIGEV